MTAQHPTSTPPSATGTIPRPGAADLAFSVTLPMPTELPLPPSPADIPKQADKLVAQLFESWIPSAESAIVAQLPPARPKGQRVEYDEDDRVSVILEWDPDPPVQRTAHDVAQAIVKEWAPQYRKVFRDGLAAAYARRLKEKVR